MRQIVRMGLVVGVLELGCGSGAATHVTSSREDLSFQGVEATRFAWSFQLFSFGNGPVETTPVTLDRIVIAEQPGYCGQAKRGVLPASGRGLLVDLERSVGAPLAKGRYTLFQSEPDGVGFASAQFLRLDASCAAVPTPLVVGGIVTVDHVDAAGAAGSVDVLLSDDTRIQGAFDAPTCDAEPPFPTTQLDGGVREAVTPTCGH